MAECVITGCGLDIGGHQYYWGDLHEQGDQWIFNAGTFKGEAHPIPAGSILGQCCLHTSADAPSFARRGVFIIPKATSELNKTAQEYLSK
jgi:hypothetical protein